MTDEPDDPSNVTTLDTTRPRRRHRQETTPATPPQPGAVPRPVGRPTTMNQGVIDVITQAISLGAPFNHACEYAGIAEQTARNWRRRGINALMNVGIDPEGGEEYDADEVLDRLKPEDHPFVEFLWALKGARSQGTMANLVKIRQATDWRSAAFILERTTEEFRPPRQEITGAGGGPIEIDARAAIVAAVSRLREAAQQAQEPAEAVGQGTKARKPRKATPRKPRA